jgi:hypothetical protein
VAFFVDGKVIAAPAFHVVKVLGVFNAPFSHCSFFNGSTSVAASWLLSLSKQIWAAKLLKIFG